MSPFDELFRLKMQVKMQLKFSLTYTLMSQIVWTVAELEAPDVELKLREYQREVSVGILKGRNDIIVLPTGTGKTAVAINLIITHLRLFGKGKYYVYTTEI